MALRQLAHKCARPLWSYLPVIKGECSVLPSYPIGQTNTLSSAFRKDLTANSITVNHEKSVSSGYNKDFIDLFTNNLHKRFYMPTNMINTLKVYQDLNTRLISIEENVNKPAMIDPPASKKPVKKEAVRMILIRRRKMRKHKLKRLRKRMHHVFAKIKLRRELRKESEFRTELLTQVEAADKFDAKAYVEDVIHKLRYCPKPETQKEVFEKLRLLKKQNKYNTTFVRPNFDDD